MIIYLFKDSQGQYHAMPEITAHSELRNRGRWQRQDLVYQGACEDIDVAPLKEQALNEALAQIPSINLLQKQIQLAELEQQDTTKIKLQLDVAMSDWKARLDRARTEFVDADTDKLITAKNALLNKKIQEAYAACTPNKSILPRNFDNINGAMGADNVTPFVLP